MSAKFLKFLVFYYWNCASKTLIGGSCRKLLIFIGHYRSSGFLKKMNGSILSTGFVLTAKALSFALGLKINPDTLESPYFKGLHLLIHRVRTNCANPLGQFVLAAPRFVLAAPKFVLAAPSDFWRPCGTKAAEQFRFTYMYYMYLHKKQAGKAEALPPLECAYGAKSPRKGRGRIEARCGGFAAQAQVIDRELSSSI